MNTWLAEARRLRSSRPAKAYRCYRRAVRLDPTDLALAEEAGMFGLTAIGARRDRNWSRYLVAARADPERQARIDPLLVPYARELLPAAAVFLVVGSLFGMLTGASVVRRGHPPIAGIGVVLAVILLFAGLYWLALAPVRRFGRDILRQVYRWPPRPIHVVISLAALLTVVLSLDLAAIAGSEAAVDALEIWVAGCYLLTIAVSLLGVPARTSLSALVEVVKAFLTR